MTNEFVCVIIHLYIGFYYAKERFYDKEIIGGHGGGRNQHILYIRSCGGVAVKRDDIGNGRKNSGIVYV